MVWTISRWQMGCISVILCGVTSSVLYLMSSYQPLSSHWSTYCCTADKRTRCVTMVLESMWLYNSDFTLWGKLYCILILKYQLVTLQCGSEWSLSELVADNSSLWQWLRSTGVVVTIYPWTWDNQSEHRVHSSQPITARQETRQ